MIEKQREGEGVIRETVRLTFTGQGTHNFDVTLYRPEREGRHPAVVWVWFAGDPHRGCPLAEIVGERGYILAGFDREAVFEDKADGKVPIKDVFPGYTFGAVRAWALAESMVATYLLERNDVDAKRLVCTGFSRCGKAALAAGIYDERFAVAAPVCSGAGGGGCFRYLGDKEGFNQDVQREESLGRIGSTFPFWWTPGFSAWWPEGDPAQMGKEDTFPVDSHILRALIAPRSLFTADGMEDTWSNPRGSALTYLASRPVFDALGARSYAFFREGGHAFSEVDWRALVDFCDGVFDGREMPKEAPLVEKVRAELEG